jgi:predicted transcriptional regulator
MTMSEIANVLKAEVLVKGEGIHKGVRHVMASDLMSDVLLVDEDDMLLLTSLASDQVLRTAQIVGAVGVIVVNGKPLPSSMVNVANDLHMTLATSRLSKYDACVAAHAALNPA